MSDTKEDLKPGYKTSEGWFTAIALLVSILYALGVVSPDGSGADDKVAALIAGILGAMGYAVSRGMAKKA